jgi:hypothetical protein
MFPLGERIGKFVAERGGPRATNTVNAIANTAAQIPEQIARVKAATGDLLKSPTEIPGMKSLKSYLDKSDMSRLSENLKGRNVQRSGGVTAAPKIPMESAEDSAKYATKPSARNRAPVGDLIRNTMDRPMPAMREAPETIPVGDFIRNTMDRPMPGTEARGEKFYHGSTADTEPEIQRTGKITSSATQSGHLTPDRSTAEAYAKQNGGKVHEVKASNVPDEALAHYRETGRGPIQLKPEHEVQSESVSRPKAQAAPISQELRDEATRNKASVKEQAATLSDANLRKLAKTLGIKDDLYDFNTRDANRHRTERDQLAQRIVDTMHPEEVVRHGDAAEEFEHNAEQKSKTKSDRATELFKHRLSGAPLDEYGNPTVSGSKGKPSIGKIKGPAGEPAPEPWRLGTKPIEKIQPNNGMKSLSDAKKVGSLRIGNKGEASEIPITRGNPATSSAQKFIDDVVASTDTKRAGSTESQAAQSGKGVVAEKFQEPTGGPYLNNAFYEDGRSVNPTRYVPSEELGGNAGKMKPIATLNAPVAVAEQINRAQAAWDSIKNESGMGLEKLKAKNALAAAKERLGTYNEAAKEAWAKQQTDKEAAAKDQQRKYQRNSKQQAKRDQVRTTARIKELLDSAEPRKPSTGLGRKKSQ